MRIQSVLAAMLMGCVLAQGGTARAEAVSVLIDGRPLAMSQPPVSEGGRLLVPLRSIFEGLGARVAYHPSTRQIHATRGASTVDLTLDSTQAAVNGHPVTLDEPAQVVNDRTVVPLRFVSEALGANVRWFALSQTVLISSAGMPPVSSSAGMPPVSSSAGMPSVRGAPPPRSAAPGGVAVRARSHLFVDVIYPSSGQTVAPDFRVRGTTVPYATVVVDGTVERPIVGGVVIPGVPLNRHHFSTQEPADAQGHFSVPVHLGPQPADSQLVLKIRALDPQGRATDPIRFTVGVGD